MLVLSRRENEVVVIGTGRDRVTITVVRCAPGKVRIGIEAPREVAVVRSELLTAPPAKPEGE